MDDWKKISEKLAHCLSCHEHDHLTGECIQWSEKNDKALKDYRSAWERLISDE